MDPEQSRQVVQAFAGAVKGLQLYPLHHPAGERQVRNLTLQLLSFLKGRETARMGVTQGALFLEGVLFTDGSAAAAEVVEILQKMELEGIEFETGLAEEEVQALLCLIIEGKEKGEKIEGALASRGVSRIRPLVQADKEENPREVYGRALNVVENVFRDVRLGKIPSSVEATRVVRSMVQLTLTAPHALLALSMLKDYDNYTFTHSVNVSVIALAVGRACGLSPAQLRILGLGALLHDLGKLKIDHSIITKPGRLTEEEFDEIRKHPTTGAELVEQMDGVSPEVVDIVIGHHLRFDRRGYPADARGREVSPMADLVAIADSYDAMTTLRCYQRPVTPRKAVESLRKLSGHVLHPKFLERFVTSLGPYPVGSLVRLDSGEVGLVIWVDVTDPDTVRLKILFDGQGTRLSDPPHIELRGPEARRIVAEVNPVSKGINVTDHFDL